MTPVSVFLVGGARPNFVKVAPVYRALTASSRFSVTLVHTGQHYDGEMSEAFFGDFGLPSPGIALEVGSGTHGSQTARVLERFERALVESEPELVVVVGDVNSTLACALAATKTVYVSGRRPRVAHVEAGLRSFDRAMPEEVNRVLTDAISDFLFTTEESAAANLAREGIAPERIFFVGNVMIDTLLTEAERAATLRRWETLGLAPREYAVVTLHRPTNVDDPRTLARLVQVLRAVAERLPVVFPVHPRTSGRIEALGTSWAGANGRLLSTPPMRYLDFLSLMSRARLVLTDSGGIQEETTVLGIPCVTLRENTERPVTLTHGTNTLVGSDPVRILETVDRILSGRVPRPVAPPELWDGKAAQRIVQVLERCF